MPPPIEEPVRIPGSSVEFQLVRLPGRPGILMGKHEVTWAEFDLFFLAERDYEGKEWLAQCGCPREFFQLRFPVFALRWHSVLAYVDWLSEKTGRRFRAPTEAEWEYACRAGRPASGVNDRAWHQGNSGRRVHPVGEESANPWGFHDLLGNVWEYCLDSDRPREYSPVLRGGSWNTPAREVRVSARCTVDPDWYALDPMRPRSTGWFMEGFHQGFRVVCVEDAADVKTLEAYASNIDVRILGHEKVGTPRAPARPALGSQVVQVSGELTNRGDRSIEELDLTVFYLDPQGKPHFFDREPEQRGRATFGRCFPVMTPLAGQGAESRPLKPGETRAWVVEIPVSFDDEDDVDANRFGARVTALRFTAKP